MPSHPDRVRRNYTNQPRTYISCYCLRELEGSWTDIGLDRVALFYPLKGWTAAKYCPHCHGNGLTYSDYWAYVLPVAHRATLTSTSRIF